MKRLLRRLSFTFCVALIAISLHAQQTVSGVVKTPDGLPLQGATISVKGTQKTVLTNTEGQFTIDAAPQSVISISHVGYEPREITITGTGVLDIQLQTGSTADLQQVVVIGYGTQQKRNLTGSVSVVDAKAVQKRMATTVGESLQGLASGVYVRGGGRPGQEAQVQIRGLKNFGNSNPLYELMVLLLPQTGILTPMTSNLSRS